LPEVGLHQYPSERKGEGGQVRSLHVPSHVPGHPQNAAKVRGFSRTASAFTTETDCLLEESGFEPLVPLQKQRNRGAGPMSPTASIRVALLIPFCQFNQHFCRNWDQRFESTFLPRRVRKLSVPA
jgi:hypothetical protein